MHPMFIVAIPLVLVIVGMVLTALGFPSINHQGQRSKILLRERRRKAMLIAVSLIYREADQ